MSWCQVLRVCSAAKLYRAAHRVPAGPSFPRLAWLTSLPSEILFISPLHLSGHSIRLLWGLPDLEANSLQSDCLSPLWCIVGLLYTLIPKGQLYWNSWGTAVPLYLLHKLGSSHTQITQRGADPLVNHSWMFCLHLRQNQPYPCISPWDSPALLSVRNSISFLCAQCNSSSGFRITGPSIATKKNHSDINLHPVLMHIYFYTRAHTGTLIHSLRLCMPTIKQA